MSTMIGAMRAVLTAETANFEAGMKRAQLQTQTTASAIEKSLGTIKTAMAGLASALSVGLLVGAIKSGLEYAGALGEVAKTLGVTTDDLQTFRFAATQSGVAQDQLEVGLRRLTVTMGKAQLGSESQIKAFRAIGISVDELKGKNTGDVFRMMADGLSKVTDRSQRAAVEMILMGRSGSQLDNLLAPGSKRLNELAEAAHELGIVLSEEQIQNAEITAHKLEELKTVLSANIAGVVANNADGILTLVSALVQLVAIIPKAIEGWKLFIDYSNAGAAAIAEDIASAYRGGQFVNPITAVKNAIAQRNNDVLGARFAADRATKAVAPAGINLPKFLAGKGPKEKKPKKEPADRSDELLAQLEKEQLQAEQSILQAKLSLAGSNEERLQISVQLVAIEKAVQDKAVDEELAKAARDLADHKITKAAYEEAVVAGNKLKAAHKTEAELKLQAIVEDELTKAEQANLEISVQKLKWQQDALHLADELATTAADHRRIQLQILDSEIAQHKLELEHEKDLLTRNHGTKEQIQEIQDRIDHLPIERAQGAASINNNTMSPLEQWRHDLPQTAADINQALQSIEVEGLDGLTEAITGIITGTEKMKDAFHQLAASILADLLKMTIKMMIFKALEAVMGGGGGGFDISSGTDFSGSFGAMSGAPGFATGGSFNILGRRGIDKNVLSLNGLPIAHVSHGERLSIGNDNEMSGIAPPVSVTMHNDFSGVDPASVARVEAKVNQMQTEFPQRVVSAWADANNRFVFKAQRR